LERSWGRGSRSARASSRKGNGEPVQNPRNQEGRHRGAPHSEQSFRGAQHHAGHHVGIAEVPAPGPEIGQASTAQGIAEEDAHRPSELSPESGQHAEGSEMKPDAHWDEHQEQPGPSRTAHQQGTKGSSEEAGETDSQMGPPLGSFP
jgi:hypothetical protein